ncbi:MAG: restriction endonuclease subunit S [Candidatus Cryptobacteroides sp.]|nr:restriction endonuclease subunit S [Candidatus Cryptobacteroides sp.]
MSKLERLIQQYCPDGVEYVKLDSVANICRGTRVVKSQLSDKGYPVYQNCLTPMGYFERSNCNAGITFVICGGAAGNVGYTDVECWAADDCEFIIGGHQVINRYIYYYLMTKQNYLLSKVRKASIPRLSPSIIKDLEIPLPPLPVQEEIVRILDAFTELQAELQAELQKRKQQYNYYLDNLLNFKNINRGGYQAEVRWMMLKDIGKVCMCKRILKSQTSSSGDVPFFKIGTFGGNADAYISQALFNEYKAKYSYPQKGEVLISAAGTIGRTIVFDGTPSYFQDSNIVWLKHDESIVLNSYLRYCYALNPWVVSTGGTIARLYNDNILEATIPVPSLANQQRIVAILDRFDRLTNDLNAGLPAEIEKRRQQYEYYRDKLLTFKRKGA